MSKHTDAIHEIFAQYLRDLREFAAKEKTEHTDRGALEKLLKAFAAQAQGKPKVQHEPKRIADKGAPDFKVIKDGMILGYVENKAIGENLSKVLKSDQITKYKTLSPNLVLTDYLEFIWITKEGSPKREQLCHDTDLENRKFKLNPERVAAVAALLAGFFSIAPEGIGTSKLLAEALAARSRLLRDYLGEELVRQEREHQEGRLFGLYKTFRDQVFHELTLKEFADAFAQMLAYGLFLARLNADDKVIITLSNARDHIPGSFQLIHELVEFLTELNKTEYQEIRWVVEEVLSIVNGLDLPAIHEDLSFRQRRAISRKVRAGDEEEHRLFERDPFIYFYEDYLKDCPDAGLAKFDGKGDETVEAVRYSEVEQAAWINKTQCFKPVPEDVWNFHIGGYQVLEKYLKSRKGRQLSLNEMKHVGKVADSLAFTIAQMAKIDKAYKKAFPDRG